MLIVITRELLGLTENAETLKVNPFYEVRSLDIQSRNEPDVDGDISSKS
jgi:hypothetical protein